LDNGKEYVPRLMPKRIIANLKTIKMVDIVLGITKVGKVGMPNIGDAYAAMSFAAKLRSFGAKLRSIDATLVQFGGIIAQFGGISAQFGGKTIEFGGNLEQCIGWLLIWTCAIQ
jgi:hypothetical protein